MRGGRDWRPVSPTRQCLDHVLVLIETHLRHILTRYFAYYHGARTHFALERMRPSRPLRSRPQLALGLLIDYAPAATHDQPQLFTVIYIRPTPGQGR